MSTPAEYIDDMHMYDVLIDTHLQAYKNKRKETDKAWTGFKENEWTIYLALLGNDVFRKPIGSYKGSHHASKIDYSNQTLMWYILHKYMLLTATHNQMITIVGFSNITAIPQETIYEWINEKHRKAGDPAVDVAKRLKQLQEQSFEAKTLEKVAIAYLAKMNHERDWDGKRGLIQAQTRAINVRTAEEVARARGMHLTEEVQVKELPDHTDASN